MRSRANFIAKRVGLNLKQSGTDIVLQWNEFDGTTTTDPTTGSTLGRPTVKTLCVQAFVHYVQATSSVRQFAEIEVGDAIVDFHQDVCLDGKNSLVYIIDGVEWMQKNIKTKIPVSWNAELAGIKIFRTQVLRKAT